MSGQLRWASGLLWFTALGWGVVCIPSIWYLINGRGIFMFMGFPAYGNGPFERIGLQSTVPLVTGFLVVSVLEGVAAYLLWRGRRAGAVLALALLVPEAFYWWGFALPIPPVLALIRTGLIASAWRSLDTV